MSLKRLLAVALAAAHWAWAAPGNACVGLGCTCSVAASPVSFGVYDPLAAGPDLTAGDVAVTCSALAAVNFSYEISLSAGGGGSFAGRRMASGADVLAYQLYADAAYSSVWGDGTAGTVTQSNSYLLTVLSGRTDHFAVHARAPAAQNVRPGAYSDAISVLIVF